MKTINIKNVDEKIYYEKLENGLEIYLYPKEDYHNNYVTFTTKFGSINNEFIPLGNKEMIKVPNGIAHFLEHKLFAQEKGPQPEEFFADNGATCNAYTTFKNTTYLFSGPNNLEDNLNFLIDYVQSPYFTDENVNSEKGIITQEIHMCNDRPSNILYEKMRENLLHNNPFKHSIIGTIEDINQIDKELLMTCYKTFYHPSNMFLVVTGNFEPKKIIDLVKKNQKEKKFSKPSEIKINNYEEKDNVVKEHEEIIANTNIPKFSYNIKIKNNLDIDKRILNLYIFILFSILFDETSDFYQRLKRKQIITNPMILELLNIESHSIICLINTTKKYKELEKEIIKELNNIKIDKKDFERKKKVLISNEIFSYEKIDVVNDMIIDSILFENKIEDNIIDIIKSLSLEELNKIIENTDFNNKSIVIVRKEKENESNKK